MNKQSPQAGQEEALAEAEPSCGEAEDEVLYALTSQQQLLFPIDESGEPSQDKKEWLLSKEKIQTPKAANTNNKVAAKASDEVAAKASDEVAAKASDEVAAVEADEESVAAEGGDEVSASAHEASAEVASGEGTRGEGGDELPPLEELFEDIEEIVHHLESEEVSLEESLRLFEQGVRYCRWASRRLDEAEGVIERLLQDPETGEEAVVPWREAKTNPKNRRDYE